MVMHSLGQEEEALALLNSAFDNISQIIGGEVVAQAAAWMGQTDLAFAALETRYGHVRQPSRRPALAGAAG
jgi:hypothetical protein